MKLNSYDYSVMLGANNAGKTNHSRINKLVDKAYNILNGELPDSGENCGYCKWNYEIVKF